MDGVVYLLRGDSHAVRLLVSVNSLTRYWMGGVTIICTDETGYKYGKQIAEACNVDVICSIHPSRKRHASFVHKTKINELSPYDSTVFLDCDTLVTGDITPIFPINDEMVLTTFGNWVSTGNKMSGRIEKWSQVAPEHVNRMQQRSWPALNTGVFGFNRRTMFMDDWYKFTDKNVSFICDEIAAQLMYPDYPVRLLDDRFNFSPRFGVFNAKKDASIYHFHGRKHLFPEAREIWLPEFASLFRKNLANVQEWCPAGDKRLAEFMRDNEI